MLPEPIDEKSRLHGEVKMKRTIYFGIMAVLAIGLCTQDAQAQPQYKGDGPKNAQVDGSDDSEPGMRRGGPGRHHKMGWLRHLDLTEEQRAEVRVLRDKMHQEMEPTFNELKNIKEQMRAMWSQTAPNEEAILALHGEVAPLKDTLRSAEIALKLSVIDILTPEQNQKRIELMADREDRKGKRGKKGKKGRGGKGPRR